MPARPERALLGAAAELLALGLVAVDHQRLGLCAAAAGLHGGAAIVLAAALQGQLPQSRRAGSFLFLLCLCAAVPVLGALGLWACARALVLAERGRGVEPRLCAEPPLPAAPGPPPRYGVGAAREVLRCSADRSSNREQRVALVRAARGLAHPDGAELLRLALLDAHEEVRLRAYGSLEQPARALSGLAEAAERDASTASLRRAAELRWEIAYRGLLQGQARARALEAAQEHVRALLGRAEHAADAGLYLLLGRALLLAGDQVQEAADALQWSLTLGMRPGAVLPYLAEAAFRLRRYREVRELLAAIPPAELRGAPRLQALAGLWLGAGAP